MRGHPYCLSCSLRIHSIFCAVRLCLLGRPAPRPAPRAAVRGVIPPFRPSCRVACCSPPVSRHRFSFRLPVSPLACSPRVPIVIALSYCLTPRSSFSPPIAPPIVSNKRGDIALLAYRCHARQRRAASLPLSCGASLPAWRAVPFLSKNSPRQFFKTFPCQFFKTFPGNLLDTIKHIHLPIYHAPHLCGSIALRRLLPSRCSLFLTCVLS